jgi:hypothetical protein
MPTYRERTPGIYRCTYLGCTEKDMPVDDGPDEPRWIFRFQEVSDPTSAGQIDKITGTSLKSPNSNAYKIAAGLIGRKLQADDDTETMVGGLYDVVYGPNQAGNLTITSVVRVTAGAPATAPVAEEVADDALPF